LACCTCSQQPAGLRRELERASSILARGVLIARMWTERGARGSSPETNAGSRARSGRYLTLSPPAPVPGRHQSRLPADTPWALPSGSRSPIASMVSRVGGGRRRAGGTGTHGATHKAVLEVLGGQAVAGTLTAYFDFYNMRRRHQGLKDRTPDEVYGSTLLREGTAA
jgi:hypothetical protein